METVYIAKEIEGRPGLFSNPLNGRTLSLTEAKANGFHIVTLADIAAQKRGASRRMTTAEKAEAARQKAQQDYADAILALPEAKGRPYAVRRIIMAHNAQSLPVDKAKFMLRSLPVELADQAPPPAASPAEDKLLARKVELKLSALSLMADQGDSLARGEHKKLAYALRLHRDSNVPIRRALSESLVDLSTLN